MSALSPTSSSRHDSLAYDRKRARAKARSAALVLAGQDIAPLPTPLNPLRRQRASIKFQFFCEEYFPHLFNLEWSEDHLRVIEKIERTVMNSETFALAMPRGSGKTTLLLVAVIWTIGSMSDAGCFKPATAVGSVSVTGSVAALGAMLDLKL